MSTIMVLGAGGMLGHKVCQRLRGQRVIGLVRRDVAEYQAYPEVFEGVELIGGIDVVEGDRLEAVIRKRGPRVVVNCVGLVKQLEAAGDPFLAVAVNALLPHRLARVCATIQARLIHISTDCVFDGRRGAYRETNVTDAVDLYGRSKALGETGWGQDSAVTLRTSFIGRELRAPHHGLVEWFLAQAGSRVDGFSRAVYTGLTSLELAEVVWQMIDRQPDLRGVCHVASEPISKLDLLRLVRDVYRLNVEIEAVEEPVCDRSLLMGSFPAATGYSAPSWREMIRRMYEDPTPYDAWRSRGPTA